MSWADAESVVETTGQEASPGALALAETMVTMITGAPDHPGEPDDLSDLVSLRNQTRLRQAICFQAVWLDGHPDVLQTMDVRGVSQDGLSAQYAHANAHLYAPLAWRCIMRLTWMKAPHRVRGPRSLVSDTGNRDSAVRDDQYVWTPLPGGYR